MEQKHGILKLTEIDNVDDRREIFYLLTLLTLDERKKFLDYTVQVINQGIVFSHDPPHVLLTVTVDTGLPQEAYMDLMLAISKYNIPIKGVLAGLTEYVRKLDKLTANYRHKVLEIPLEKLIS